MIVGVRLAEEDEGSKVSSDQVGDASNASTSTFERVGLVVWKFTRCTRQREKYVRNEKGGILLVVTCLVFCREKYSHES